MDANKRYIIDLSLAQSPADIVFELSSIIEKTEAANKTIWIKLGDITLNQSQLLSINSLINSINSTLDLIETQSNQTELVATTLGIKVKNIDEEIQGELQEVESLNESPIENEPSEQYIPMTDHIDEEPSNSKEEEEEKEEVEHDVQEDILEQESNEEPNIVSENSDEESQETEKTTDIPSNEEIQTHLDSIFDSESKLENILSEDKEIGEMKNWPLTKEIGEFDVPEEIMTDEDYEILQMNTQYHKQTVRSGQVIKSKGNVVIIGDCHPGCEIHAAGDITVWGVMGGIAHAGSNGNTKARIRALNLNAIQLRIADSFARRPDHIKNAYVEKTNTFTPEEARNINGSIVILKINDK